MAVLHTSVPYLWRRVLGLLRPFLGISCALLYLFRPVPNGTLLGVLSGAYAAWAFVLLLRDSVENSGYPAFLLLVDAGFLACCLLHRGDAGWWLSTIVYLYVLTFAALLYEWSLVAAVAVASSILFCVAWSAQPRPLWPVAGIAAMVAVVMAVQKKTLQARMVAALKRSVLSRSEAENAREAERERIAADFHDGPLQSFISFQMRLEVIRQLLARDPEAGIRELLQLQDLGRSQVTELRAFVRQMHPTEIKSSNLQAAIREAIDHFERDSGIDAEVACGDFSVLQPETAIELLQLVREALNNVRKHSKASRVAVRIESSTAGVDLSVEDDGSGFSFGGSFNLDELELLRLGPRSIKRRVRTLGGDMVVESRPTHGSTLTIHLPA